VGRQPRCEFSSAGRRTANGAERRTLEPAKRQELRPDALPHGQVVDVAPGNGEVAPDAKYLAESANKVEKERRAKEQTPFYRNAMPRTTATNPQQGQGHDSVDKAQSAGNNGLATTTGRCLIRPRSAPSSNFPTSRGARRSRSRRTRGGRAGRPRQQPERKRLGAGKLEPPQDSAGFGRDRL